MLHAKPRVLVAVDLTANLLERLRAECETIEVDPKDLTREAFLGILPRVDAVATTVACRFDQEALGVADRLRVISTCGVGLDHIDTEEAGRRGVTVCNVPGVQNEAVAELALTMMLALSRNLVANSSFVRSGAWQTSRPALSPGVRGRSLGLLGFGGIGRALADMANSLGMDVMYFRPSGSVETTAARYVSRETLLRESDFLSLHLPLTEETRNAIGKSELAAMKPGAFLINTARGEIVDEEALVEALESGLLAGAGLDVVAEEPLRADSPLCRFPNVILQPHAGGMTVDTQRAVERAMVENLLKGLCTSAPR